ncbi:MAG: HAMP domain-containing histidine kinase [Acidobacteria bacterium]|nr:HAMP domain-containing histidine kinase [Acidobacteriota bacterium]
MRLRIPTTWLWASVAALLVALLLSLAFLQFRWIDAVTVAERERMQAHLRAASGRLTQEFDHEVMRACMTFLVAPFEWREGHWRDVGGHARVWRQTAAFPNLIRSIYVINIEANGAAALHRYQEGDPALASAKWEERFESVRARLTTATGQGGPPVQWRIDTAIPALVLYVSDTGARQGEPGAGHEKGAVILELDEDYLRRTLLPALVSKHLAVSAGLDYEVEVRTSDAGRLIFPSPAAHEPGAGKPDLELPFFALRPEEASRFAPLAAFEASGPGRRGQGQPKGRGPRADRPSFRGRGLAAQSVQGGGEGHWRLAVRHRAGSLEAAVDGLRKRNLALGFAMLLLLGASVLLIVTLTRRTQKLARAHSEFLAGISHELLTPLAVIRSAADNLADGVAVSNERAQQYGEIIRKQSRRLSEMVQDALGFAVAQSVARERFREVAVEDVVRRAVETCRPAIAEAGVEFVQQVEPGLPAILGDATALSHMLRNLIMNGVQYGGSGGSLALKVKRARTKSGDAVEITVEDKGGGIAPGELQRIFEPFFRGQGAAQMRLHGTGLGLSLVKRIAEDHRGTVSVESQRPGGTVFTVRLPAAGAE